MAGRRLFKNLTEIPAHLRPSNLSAAQVPPHRPAERCNKYRNQPIVVDGQRFDSKREARDFQNLLLRKHAGEIRAIIRQVSIPLLSGKRRMRLDFVVIMSDGAVRWLDSKGFATKDWLIKRDEVEAAYGIKIETL
jgi:hypothetical protein